MRIVWVLLVLPLGPSLPKHTLFVGLVVVIACLCTFQLLPSPRVQTWSYHSKSSRRDHRSPPRAEIYMPQSTGWLIVIVLIVFGAIVLMRRARTRAARPAATAPFLGQPGALYPARINGKWGYLDHTGKVAIAPQWDDAGEFVDGLAPVGNRGQVQESPGVTRGTSAEGFIDTTGAVVIPLRYDHAHAFAEGLARVCKDQRWGFIDRAGNELVPVEYEDAADFAEGLAAVKRGDKTGFVDATGKLVIPFQFKRAAWIASFHDGLACAFVGEDEHEERAGYIDRTGTLVIPPRFAFAQPFSEGLAQVMVSLAGPIAFIDREGAVVFEVEGRQALSFAEGLAAIEVRGPNDQLAWSYFDRTGKVVLERLPYRHAGIFREGRAGVARGDAWGFVDREGKEVVPPRYAGINLFKNGLARMETGSLFGGLKIVYVDREGCEVWRE